MMEEPRKRLCGITAQIHTYLKGAAQHAGLCKCRVPHAMIQSGRVFKTCGSQDADGVEQLVLVRQDLRNHAGDR